MKRNTISHILQVLIVAAALAGIALWIAEDHSLKRHGDQQAYIKSLEDRLDEELPSNAATRLERLETEHALQKAKLNETRKRVGKLEEPPEK